MRIVPSSNLHGSTLIDSLAFLISILQSCARLLTFCRFYFEQADLLMRFPFKLTFCSSTLSSSTLSWIDWLDSLSCSSEEISVDWCTVSTRCRLVSRYLDKKTQTHRYFVLRLLEYLSSQMVFFLSCFCISLLISTLLLLFHLYVHSLATYWFQKRKSTLKSE